MPIDRSPSAKAGPWRAWSATLIAIVLAAGSCALVPAQVVIADAVRFASVTQGGPEVISDNSQPGFFTNGSWGAGQFAGGHLGNYLYASQSDSSLSTAYWRTQIPSAGEYDVFVWYSASTNRSRQARYAIEHAGGVSTTTLDQTSGGGWTLLGRYHFEPHRYFVQLSNRLSSDLVEPLTVDDGDPLFHTTGSWTNGTVSAGYLDDYLFAGCSAQGLASATWDLLITTLGNYRLSVWFGPGSNRVAEACYSVQCRLGTITRLVNQTAGEPGWRSLGILPFEAGSYQIRLSNSGPSDRVVIADAAKMEPGPPGPTPVEIEMLYDQMTTPSAFQAFPVRARVWSASPLTTVTALRTREDGTTAQVALADDGLHGDELAGDGIYGGMLAGGPAASLLSYSVSAANQEGGLAVSPAQFCLVAYDSFGAPETRWVFGGGLTPQSIDALPNRVRSGNFNAIGFTARSVGDARYHSEIELPAAGMPEGFDPLGHLIHKAHDTSGGKSLVQVHPLVLVYRVLTSDTPPQGHVLDRHPEWTSENYAGVQYVGDRLYVDQGIPEVQDYLVDVFNEIAENYAIDGLNLDFIRYREQDFGYNALALGHFHHATGRTDRPAIDDPQWCAWRRQQVSALVRRVYANLLKLRPQAVLSIDGVCWNEPNAQLERNNFHWDTYQEWPVWLHDGFTDVVLGMAYRREDTPALAAQFIGWHTLLQQHSHGRRAVAIAGAYQNPVQHSLVQMHKLRRSGSDWIAVFSDGPDSTGVPADQFYAAARSQLFPTPVPPAACPWKNQPTGTVMGIVRRLDGSPCRLCPVQLGSQQTQTDLCGFYAFFGVTPGNYTLRATRPGGATPAEANVTVSSQTVTEQNLQLSPTAADAAWLGVR